MAVADSKKVVVAALAGNVAIAICKLTAALLSHSTATLAEAAHSVADSGNQALLLLGIGLALKPADEDFPFGRAAERYFWPFVVALMLFSLGGTFAIVEGVHRLIAGPSAAEIAAKYVQIAGVRFQSVYLSYGVLGASFFFEAMSFRVAYREFQIIAKGKPIIEAIFDARDPTVPLVLAEDTTALIGLGIALAAVILSHVTGNFWWDPLGSVLIGILLAAVSVILARVTHALLIGKSVLEEDRMRILDIVQKVPGVDKVTQLLAMHLGPDVVIVALKIAFRRTSSVEEVEATTNAMEKDLREAMPELVKIFVEADSKGDGRGIHAWEKHA
ncbi:MAG: cation diffusion facilitator family transporter [Polyangiaceae bacterium]